MADTSPGPAPRRWPYQGRPQLLLLVSGLVMAIASFLPWFDTAFGSTNGAAVGGLWTFYAGLMGVAGAVWRRRGVVAAHAAVIAVLGVGLPLWRLLWAASRLPAFGEAWVPGPGLVLVLISGGVATYALVRLVRAGAASGAGPSVTRANR